MSKYALSEVILKKRPYEGAFGIVFVFETDDGRQPIRQAIMVWKENSPKLIAETLRQVASNFENEY